MRVEWTEPAVADLQAITDYIARDSALYAKALAERIILNVEHLTTFPKSGRVVPEVGNPNVREIVVESYRVVYRIKHNRVQILAIIHCARDVARLKQKPWETS